MGNMMSKLREKSYLGTHWLEGGPRRQEPIILITVEKLSPQLRDYTWVGGLANCTNGALSLTTTAVHDGF